MTAPSHPDAPVQHEDRIPIIIGITGHRDPADPERLARHFEIVLEAIEREVPHSPIWLLTPLAAGADQIFARTGLRCLRDRRAARRDGGEPPPVELAVPLPFTREDYRCDFLGDPEALATFDELSGQAAWTLELPPRDEDHDLVVGESLDGREIRRVGEGNDHATIAASAVRAIHYDRLGRFMATHAHIMISAWDGDLGPANRPAIGGTAAVLQYCINGDASSRERGVPCRAELSPLFSRGEIASIVVPCGRSRNAGVLAREEVWNAWRKEPQLGQSGSSLHALLATSPGRILLETGMPDSSEGRADATDSFEKEAVDSLKRIDEINRLIAPDASQLLSQSREHRDAGRWFRPLETVATPVHRFLLASRLHRLATILLPLTDAPVNGSRIRDEWVDRGLDLRRADQATGRLLGILCRLDMFAQLDKRSYQRASLVAMILLATALVFLQLYGLGIKGISSIAVCAYLLLLLAYSFWKKRLRRREQKRAHARTLAELLRIQLAWRLAGVPTLIDDVILPRRRRSLTKLDPVLIPINLLSVTHDFDITGEYDAALASKVWIEDQLNWLEESIEPKEKVARNRRSRLQLFRRCVIVVAVAAAWVSLIDLAGLMPTTMNQQSIADIAGFLMGVSLVVVLITQFRAQSSLDREDADAGRLSVPLFRMADQCLRQTATESSERRARQLPGMSRDRERIRRVLIDLGINIADEQIEWHERRDRGADLDMVG